MVGGGLGFILVYIFLFSEIRFLVIFDTFFLIFAINVNFSEIKYFFSAVGNSLVKFSFLCSIWCGEVWGV